MAKNHGQRPLAPAVPPPREVSEPIAPPPEKAEGASVEPGGLTVKNRTDTWLRQPSTGTIIEAGEEQFLKNDGWLFDQIKAGLLIKVK